MFGCISVRKELRSTSSLILSSRFFLARPILTLLTLPPSLFHPAKNHRTGNEGLSFSYLPEQRAHRAAEGGTFLFTHSLSLCFTKVLAGNGLHYGDHTDTRAHLRGPFVTATAAGSLLILLKSMAVSPNLHPITLKHCQARPSYQ